MLRKVDITDGGDTSFIKGEQVDYIRVVQENQAVLAQNKFPAKFERQLMGITKASLLLTRSSLLHRSRKQLVC